jgi:hypothetical protein
MGFSGEQTIVAKQLVIEMIGAGLVIPVTD